MPDTDPVLMLAELGDASFRRTLARLAILRAYARHREAHRLSDAAAQDEVAEQFTAGRLQVDELAYAVYDSVSGRTLRRWEHSLQEGGLAALADDHGRRSARSYASYFGPGSEMRKVALYHLADHPDCTSTDLMNALRERFEENDLPDRRTVQRFLARMGG